MEQQFFSFESELKNNDQTPSSHCSSVQERLASYGSEALDTTEHLALILGSHQDANAILHHFGSLSLLARASVWEKELYGPGVRKTDDREIAIDLN